MWWRIELLEYLNKAIFQYLFFFSFSDPPSVFPTPIPSFVAVSFEARPWPFAVSCCEVIFFLFFFNKMLVWDEMISRALLPNVRLVDRWSVHLLPAANCQVEDKLFLRILLKFIIQWHNLYLGLRYTPCLSQLHSQCSAAMQCNRLR